MHCKQVQNTIGRRRERQAGDLRRQCTEKNKIGQFFLFCFLLFYGVYSLKVGHCIGDVVNVSVFFFLSHVFFLLAVVHVGFTKSSPFSNWYSAMAHTNLLRVMMYDAFMYNWGLVYFLSIGVWGVLCTSPELPEWVICPPDASPRPRWAREGGGR